MDLSSLFEGRSTLGVVLVIALVGLIILGASALGGLMLLVFLVAFGLWVAYNLLGIMRNWRAM